MGIVSTDGASAGESAGGVSYRERMLHLVIEGFQDGQEFIRDLVATRSLTAAQNGVNVGAETHFDQNLSGWWFHVPAGHGGDGKILRSIDRHIFPPLHSWINDHGFGAPNTNFELKVGMESVVVDHLAASSTTEIWFGFGNYDIPISAVPVGTLVGVRCQLDDDTRWDLVIFDNTNGIILADPLPNMQATDRHHIAFGLRAEDGVRSIRGYGDGDLLVDRTLPLPIDMGFTFSTSLRMGAYADVDTDFIEWCSLLGDGLIVERIPL